MEQKLLMSEKKTCTKERLLKVLSAIAELKITSEGEGGQTQGYYGCGDYYVGTGLRHPDMPFYYKPKSSRRSVLKHLEDNGLITIKSHEEDEWTGFEVTVNGWIVLEAYNKCENCGKKLEWYNSEGFHQNSPTSGYHYSNRILVCECKKEEFEQRCRASKNTNMKMGLGKKIEVKK